MSKNKPNWEKVSFKNLPSYLEKAKHKKCFMKKLLYKFTEEDLLLWAQVVIKYIQESGPMI